VVIPENNADHMAIIDVQKRDWVLNAFYCCQANCSIQSYVPALSPLRKFGIKQIIVCTYQAISGARKTFRIGRKWSII
jgi:aspartate-semialdehyde dehydrogenase